MDNVLDRLPRNARIAVVRLRSLGDCVLTTPALHILKQSRPDTEIGVVVEDRFAAVFEGNPDIAAILPPEVAALRRFHPELCVNLHGGTRSMVLTASSGARVRVGFAHFRGTHIYNCRIPTAQQILQVDRKVHTAEHVASAIFYLGAERQPIARARLFAPPIHVTSPYAVIHAVAAIPEKTWNPEGFLAVAKYLERDLEPVFIAGPGEDLSAYSAYRTITGAPLTETKSLLQSASLFIGNDSGPAHMAAAFGVPVVVLFGPSDPVVWAPWQVPSKVLTGQPIQSIQPSDVIEAVSQLRVAR